MKIRRTRRRAVPKPRNPHARALTRLGHPVVPSKRAYSRKGRRRDGPAADPNP